MWHWKEWIIRKPGPLSKEREQQVQRPWGEKQAYNHERKKATWGWSKATPEVMAGIYNVKLMAWMCVINRDGRSGVDGSVPQWQERPSCVLRELSAERWLTCRVGGWPGEGTAGRAGGITCKVCARHCKHSVWLGSKLFNNTHGMLRSQHGQMC